MTGQDQGPGANLDYALKICEACCQTETIGSSHAGLPCSACPIFELLSEGDLPVGSGARQISRKDKALVQNSFAQLQPHLELFAFALYDALFARHPHIKLMFGGDQGEQSRKLAAMLTTMVKGLSLRAPDKVTVRPSEKSGAQSSLSMAASSSSMSMGL